VSRMEHRDIKNEKYSSEGSERAVQMVWMAGGSMKPVGSLIDWALICGVSKGAIVFDNNIPQAYAEITDQEDRN
jgi:hypothetical protein